MGIETVAAQRAMCVSIGTENNTRQAAGIVYLLGRPLRVCVPVPVPET